MSCHHTSRESSQATSWPVRRTTTTFSTRSPTLVDGLVDRGLEGGRRTAAVAAVGGDDHAAWQSTTREAKASAEKPPKTTVWIAPSRAQASIATATSGIIGI
jgi:hypothetical protein